MAIPHINGYVRVDFEGLHWLYSEDILHADVVTIGPPDPRTDHPDDNLFEVIAYVPELSSYWVRPLRPPDYIT